MLSDVSEDFHLPIADVNQGGLLAPFSVSCPLRTLTVGLDETERLPVTGTSRVFLRGEGQQEGH